MTSPAQQRTKRALPTTVLIHGLLALAGAATAATIGSGLEVARVPAGEWARAADALIAEPALPASWLASLAVWAVVWTLLSPWLRVAWLHALRTGQTPLSCMAAGLSLWPRALLQAWAVGAVCALGCLPLIALPWGTFNLLDQTPEVPRLLASAGTSLPLLTWLLVCTAWRDLSAARLSVHARLQPRDLREAFRHALQPRTLLQLAALGALAFGWTLAAMQLSLMHPGLLALTGAQLLLLARTLTRSRWLAHASHVADLAKSGVNGVKN